MSLKKKKLIASDLDGTLFIAHEPGPAEGLREFAGLLRKHPEICFVFATGRSLTLIKEAIKCYRLPLPDMAIGDVGTSLYVRRNGAWELDEGWRAVLAQSWQGASRDTIARLLEGIGELREQEQEKLTEFKQSYYLDIAVEWSSLEERIREILSRERIEAELIYSVHQREGRAFLDILPPRAAKDEAVAYVCNRLGLDLTSVLYAGDSGNDLLAFTRGFNAVVVGNTPDEVKRQARRIAGEKGIGERVYCALRPCVRGILEGISHFEFIDSSGNIS